MAEASSLLRAEILSEIEIRGPIPFSRFMELCLYHPRYGYYTRGVGGGCGRDYLTSSGTHRAFGVLVAKQVVEMWSNLGRPEHFAFVEFGPGEGLFAVDFLREAQRSGPFAQALEYVLVELSPALRARQQARLEGLTPIPISWVREDQLDRRGRLVGCLFANEVLDAFPVHRLLGTGDGVLEVHVAAEGGRLTETLLPLSDQGIETWLSRAALELEPDQEVDINLEAPDWIARAVGLLEHGYIMIIDYGHEARELYDPARRRGTLLAYHRHRTNEDFLLRPGDQDMTAHLDFTDLRLSAERSGARFLGLVPQSRFLLALGAVDFLKDTVESPQSDVSGEDEPQEVRRLRDREALKELILPGRVGERFKVMALAVGEAPGDLSGLVAPWLRYVPASGDAKASGHPGARG